MSDKIDFTTLPLTRGAFTAGSQSTASTSYVALGTATSVTIDVPASGIVDLSFGANFDGAANTSGFVSIVATGANSISAGTYFARGYFGTPAANVGSRFLLERRHFTQGRSL